MSSLGVVEPLADVGNVSVQGALQGDHKEEERGSWQI